MTKRHFTDAATSAPKPNMPDLFRDVHALSTHDKRSLALLKSVLERAIALAAYNPKDAQLALSRVVRNIEWEQQYNEAATPLLIDVYKTIVERGDNPARSRALGNILTYSRQHSSEEAKIVRAAISSLPDYARGVEHYNVGNYVAASRKIIDHAAATRDRDVMEDAFCAMWSTAASLKPELEHDAHQVIWESYGVAQRKRFFPEYIESGKGTLFHLRQRDPESKIAKTIMHAIASAAHHHKTGGMKLDF